MPPSASTYDQMAQTGPDVSTTEIDAFGFCDTYLGNLAGRVMTISRSNTAVIEGCTLREDYTATFTFTTDTHYNAAVNHHVTAVAGACSGSCDWNLVAQSNRCANCWPGCPAGATRDSAGSSSVLDRISVARFKN